MTSSTCTGSGWEANGWWARVEIVLVLVVVLEGVVGLKCTDVLKGDSGVPSYLDTAGKNGFFEDEDDDEDEYDLKS